MSNYKDKTIIDVKSGNIISRETHNQVKIVGMYLGDGDSFLDKVEIIIIKENDEDVVTAQIPYSGYFFQLFLGDFNNDGLDEIMVIGEYGDAKKYCLAIIYKYEEDKLIDIFSHDTFNSLSISTAKYLEQYKVMTTTGELNKSYIYDISNSSKEYLDLIYDKSGNVRPNQEPIVSEVKELYPIKKPSEKYYQLLVKQAIHDVDKSLEIGYIESKVSLEKNIIKVVEVCYCEQGLKSQKQNSAEAAFNEIFPRDAIFIDTYKLNFDINKNKVDIDGDGIYEYIVPYTVDGVPYVSLINNVNGKYKLKGVFKGDGYGIKDMYLKKYNDKFYIIVGFIVDKKEAKLYLLEFKANKIVKINEKGHGYSKLKFKSFNNDKKEQMILWTHDCDEAYYIEIYDFEKNSFRLTNKFDKDYFNEVVVYYEKLIKKYKDSSLYSYHLALAYIRSGNSEKGKEILKSMLANNTPYPSFDVIKKQLKRI